ncbi:MAG: glycosyltransferase family 2 protein [Sphingomonadaceae bacterium]|nr:glycosyltransferase family 2 protein [Sphingomonadaceae bacterium]
MSEPPFISVLINNFNYARFLRAAVDSALEQDYPAFEVVVVDDRSTDDSPAILASYGNRIRPLHLERNGGQAHAVNHGFPLCRGALIAMLDADDAFLPGKLAAVAEAAARAPEALMICDRVQQITADGARWGKPIPQQLPAGDIRARAARRGGIWECPPMSGLTFRRSLLERLLPESALPHRVSFDHYLANIAALTAPIAALDAPWTLRRLHGRNKYKHPARIERQRWTLDDDMRRIERMSFFINQGLAKLGEPVRVAPDRKLWYATVRYWAGEIGFGSLLRTWLPRPPDRNPARLFRSLRQTRLQRKRIRARDG